MLQPCSRLYDQFGTRSQASAEIDILTQRDATQRIIEAKVSDGAGAKTHQTPTQFAYHDGLTLAEVISVPIDWLPFVVKWPPFEY
jgi:hypothetical protein